MHFVHICKYSLYCWNSFINQNCHLGGHPETDFCFQFLTLKNKNKLYNHKKTFLFIAYTSARLFHSTSYPLSRLSSKHFWQFKLSHRFFIQNCEGLWNYTKEASWFLHVLVVVTPFCLSDCFKVTQETHTVRRASFRFIPT